MHVFSDTSRIHVRAPQVAAREKWEETCKHLTEMKLAHVQSLTDAFRLSLSTPADPFFPVSQETIQKRKEWLHVLDLDNKDGAIVRLLREALNVRNYNDFSAIRRKLQQNAHQDRIVRAMTSASLEVEDVWPKGDPLTEFMKRAVSFPVTRVDFVSHLCAFVEQLAQIDALSSGVSSIVTRFSSDEVYV